VQTGSDEAAVREHNRVAVIRREYCRDQGQRVSKELFSATVQSIAQHAQLLDISRTAAVDSKSRSRFAAPDEKERVEANAARVRKHASDLCTIISESVQEFVNALGPVLPALKAKVEERFPGNDKFLRDSVVGLFFLRYICYGLANALEWGLLTVEDKRRAAKIGKKGKIVYDPHVFRNITFVVKLLQKIANSDTFDEREDFAVFNRYIPKMSKKLANFIDEMLEEDAEWPNSAADPETHGAERDLRIVDDYIANSGSEKGPECKHTIMTKAKKITRSRPRGRHRLRSNGCRRHLHEHELAL